MLNLLIYITAAKLSIATLVPGMAFVAEGKFKLWNNNIEKHVKSFYIDVYEVTNAEYLDFTNETEHSKPFFIRNDKLNLPVQPVVGVNFSDAKSYCKWAKKRLPTSLEWEKAASFDEKTGNTLKYPWGNSWDHLRLNTIRSNINKATIVGMYPQGKSPYGLYDMGGNVWEWTGTWHKEKIEGVRNFRLIVKGGSWGNKDNSDYASPAVDGALESQLKLSNVGFRCVKDMKNIKQ